MRVGCVRTGNIAYGLLTDLVSMELVIVLDKLATITLSFSLRTHAHTHAHTHAGTQTHKHVTKQACKQPHTHTSKHAHTYNFYLSSE